MDVAPRMDGLDGIRVGWGMEDLTVQIEILSQMELALQRTQKLKVYEIRWTG